MAFVRVRRRAERWTEQPQERVEAAPYPGLVNLWNFGDQSGRCLLTDAAMIYPASATAVSWLPGGLLQASIALWSTQALRLPLAAHVLAPMTLVLGWRLQSGTVPWSLMNPLWDGWYGSSSGNGVRQTNNSDFAGLVSPVSGGPRHPLVGWVAVHCSNNDLRASLDGGDVAIDTTTPAPTPESPNSTFYIGADSSGTNQANVLFSHLAVIMGEVDDDELRELAANPWGRLVRPRRVTVPGYSAAYGSFAQTLSISAAIQESRALTAGLSAAIQESRTTSAVTDAAVSQARTAQAALDAAVSDARSAVAALQAAVQQSPAASAAADAAVQSAITAALSLDLAVQAQRSATAGLSAQVQADSSAAVGLDGYVQAGTSLGVQLAAAVLHEAVATLGADVAVSQARSATAGLSAALQVALQAAATMDAAVQHARTVTLGLSAQVQDGFSATAVLDAAVLHASAATAALQAVIVQAGATQLAMGAAVSLARSVGAAMGGAILGASSAGVGLSAYIFDGDLTFALPSASRLLRVAAENRILKIRP